MAAANTTSFPSPKTGAARSTSPPKATPDPFALYPKTQGVQFSTLKAQTSRSVSPSSRTRQERQQQHLAEASSADEITPIVGQERGNAKKKHYDTAGSTLDNGVGPSRRSSASSTKRRKRSSNRAVNNGREEGERSEKGGWWKDLVEKYGSVELDNKGSVARDHLALERTFLAWLRTSLAFASIGIAVTQLFRLNTTISEREGYKPNNPNNTYHLHQVGKPLGATFLGIAILVLLAGGRRYFESQHWIIRGKFPASRGSVFLITFVALTLIVTSLIVVCVVDPSVFEKK